MRLALLAAVISCGPRTPNAPPPPTPRDASAAPPASDAAPASDSPPAVSVTDEDCAALAAATAIAIAKVTASDADCSGIGNLRAVLAVDELVRGQGIATVVASRPLYGKGHPAYDAGERYVVALAPGKQPAQTVQCVALPAHEAKVTHAIAAASLDAARAIVGACKLR